ncbi:hypothetical protein J437_LFUL007375 [Ladona fulva]|uniref:Uncharacterized protein n=1 Tax=Ladona fulva TaxID=123851 RepID=A0A8K0K1Y7_LADFU|nr:hypothetical protein J437_LFUL007375 [Ladona fulva]
MSCRLVRWGSVWEVGKGGTLEGGGDDLGGQGGESGRGGGVGKGGGAGVVSGRGRQGGWEGGSGVRWRAKGRGQGAAEVLAPLGGIKSATRIVTDLRC